jgi:ribosomal protein S18 acetylase RimI-like enzyme
VTVRRAEPDDAGAVAEVFTPSFATLAFLPRLHTQDEDRAFIRDVVFAQQEVWVAEERGRVVGFAALSSYELEHLYVHPDEQRRGVGDALLAKTKERRPQGFTFWVFQENEAARSFYEARGCRVVRLTDGSGTEWRAPDALYEWRPS